MKLTKTDFLQYLNCPNSLWLLKNKLDIYQKYKEEKSLFLEKLINEGYEVEEYVEKLFPEAQNIKNLTFEEVKKKLSENRGKFFQATFETKEGVFARIDMLEIDKDKKISLYEIKSSTSVKKDKKHNHLKDISFQKYILEENGYIIKNLYIIHLNKNFIKNGKINPQELLKITPVDKEVSEIFDKTILEIKSALEFINKKKINENLCSCLENTRTNHCDTFKYFNKDIPNNSIYQFNNIRAKKIILLKDMGIKKISDVPDDFKLSEYQVLQRESILIEQAVFDQEKIKLTLNKFKFPLYFFDYETLPFAVPKVDGYWPHAHLPTQYSIHILNKDGEIKHFEYLAEKLENPKKLIESMQKQIGSVGTLISWKKSYEEGKNKEMAKMFPQYQNFLLDINKRTFDLMDIFFKDKSYIDKNFNGSNSIKKIQPILVPDLSYKTLDIQDGTMSVDMTEKLFFKITDKKEIQETRKALLKYCELDTLAMLKIYQVLKNKFL